MRLELSRVLRNARRGSKTAMTTVVISAVLAGVGGAYVVTNPEFIENLFEPTKVKPHKDPPKVKSMLVELSSISGADTNEDGLIDTFEVKLKNVDKEPGLILSVGGITNWMNDGLDNTLLLDVNAERIVVLKTATYLSQYVPGEPIRIIVQTDPSDLYGEGILGIEQNTMAKDGSSILTNCTVATISNFWLLDLADEASWNISERFVSFLGNDSFGKYNNIDGATFIVPDTLKLVTANYKGSSKLDVAGRGVLGFMIKTNGNPSITLFFNTYDSGGNLIESFRPIVSAQLAEKPTSEWHLILFDLKEIQTTGFAVKNLELTGIQLKNDSRNGEFKTSIANFFAANVL